MAKDREASGSVFRLMVLLYLVAGIMIAAGYGGWSAYRAIRWRPPAPEAASLVINPPDHPYSGHVAMGIDCHLMQLPEEPLPVVKASYFQVNLPEKIEWAIQRAAISNGERISSAMSSGGYGRGQFLGSLSAPEFDELKAMVAALPPSQGWPEPKKPLLITRFESKTEVTRFFYDRTRLPAEVVALSGLLGFPSTP